MLGATAVRRYVSVMAAKGYPLDMLLSGSGISYPVLSNPACVVTHSQYRSIMGNLLDLSDGQGVNLAASAFRDLGDLGIVGHASATSQSVRDTYRVWSRFGPTLVGMMGRLQIVEEDVSSVTFGVASPEPSDPLFQFSVEELLTMVGKVSRTPDDRCPSVRDLSLSYRAPSYAERYEELLGCRMRFGAEQTTIRVWREWFDRPAQPYDEEFNGICVHRCEDILRRLEGARTVTLRLNDLLDRARDGAFPKLSDAAGQLNMTGRTLRRRLRDEGTSYQQQIDGFREARAKEWLACGLMPPKQIAFRLGFRDPSAFRHAFKGWTDMTVGEYQRWAAENSPLPK